MVREAGLGDGAAEEQPTASHGKEMLAALKGGQRWVYVHVHLSVYICVCFCGCTCMCMRVLRGYMCVSVCPCMSL